MDDAPALLEVDDLCVATMLSGHSQPVETLARLSLTVDRGEHHAVLAQSSAEASSLARALMGAPDIHLSSGCIRFAGDDVTGWDTDVRSKAGMFLSFAHPQGIDGVSVLRLLLQALADRSGVELSVTEIQQSLSTWMDRLDVPEPSSTPYLSEQLSSLDKKRNELVQLAMIQPELAILDETGQDLDLDTIHVLTSGVREIRNEHPGLSTLTITHHLRLLDELKPDIVHVLLDGRIVATGGRELALRLATEGYDSFR